MLTVDGFHGGQVTRIAVALSSVLGEEIRIVRIRENRPNPGLRPQHIKAIEAVALLSDADVEGLRVGSREIVFRPGELRRGRVKLDTGTAGSLSLIVQAFLIPALFKGAELVARGGTDVPFAPPVDYLRLVTLPTLERFGLRAELEVVSRGYYPRGGGEIFLKVEKSTINPIEVKKAEKTEFSGISHATNLPGVAKRMKSAALKVLAGKVNVKIDVEEVEAEPWKKGCAIVIGGFGRGGSSIGKKGKRAEIVGKEAAVELISALDRPLDQYMSDQILPFVALFGGSVRILETSHVRALLKLFREFGIEFSYRDGLFEAPGALK